MKKKNIKNEIFIVININEDFNDLNVYSNY